MQRIYFSIQSLLLLSIIIFISCNSGTTSSDTETNNTENKTIIDSVIQSVEPEESKQETTDDKETFNVTAKFLEFSLGDASHFVFEDEKGNILDFGGNDTDEFTFAHELEPSESNSDNQGWGSNEALQGKWFEITYYKNEQPLYIDGPMATVDIISKVTLKK